MNDETKDVIYQAFKYIEMGFNEYMKNCCDVPLKLSFTVADFENKKDYKLTLELKEVSKK